MPSLASVNNEAQFTMLKGEPGTRKSTQALSYPGPQFWFSWDKKMEALILPAKRWGIKMSDINYEDYDDWDKPRAMLEKLQVNCPYKTLIADSLTSEGDGINRQTRKFKVGEGGGKRIANISVNSIEDYNAEAAAFQEFMALIKDVHKYHNVNVILIAHVVGQRSGKDETNKLTHHSRVIITGGDKISGKIAAYCTEVYHFNVTPNFEADKEGSYGLFTVHTGNDFARTSLPLPQAIQFNNEPLYEKFILPAINKLKAEKPVERIPTQPTITPTTTVNTPSPFTTSAK